MAWREQLEIGRLTVGSLSFRESTVEEQVAIFDLPIGIAGKVIETGDYSSTAGNAVELDSSNTRPNSFLGDDGGSAATGDIRNLLSRVLLTANHTGSLTIDAIRGQIKFADGVDFDADYASGVRGYVEIAGATDMNLNNDDHAVSALHGRVEVAANMAIEQGHLTGLYLELNTTGAYSVTQDADGILSAVTIAITDQKNDAWGHGIWMQDGSVDTGLTMSGASMTALSLGAMTQIMDVTGAVSGLGFDLGPGWGGASAANALILGGGTSADPMTTATAGKVFMEFRTESTATSGDSRCLYMRHAINGAGGGGESLRSFSKVTAAASTVRGAHISLDFGTGGSCSGFGAGLDAQVLHANETNSSTLTALNLEFYASGASTDISGLNSFIRCVFNGNATGIANYDDDVVLLSIVGATAGAGQMFDSTIDTAGAQIDHTLKINIGGTNYYIPVMDNADGS